MKKGLFLFVLMAISAMTFAQTQHASEWTNILSNQPETFRTQLVSSSEHSIKVNVQVPGFFTSNVATPRGEAKIISLPESISTAKAGEPNVPMMGIPVMIGDKARMSTRIVDAQYMDFENIEVAPSKGDFSRQIDPSTVPYTYGECYNQDAFFPSSNLDLYEPYIIRDFRGQNMAVYPFAYNPVTKTLRVYYNMTMEMYKMDENGANVIERRRSNVVKMDPDFKSVYQRHFINYEAGMSKYTAVDEEGDLLIICYDDFISAMTDFVNWKKTRGVNTTIVGTTAAGSTYSAIKTYIQNQYNANNNLTHVLLVGDVAQIPGYSYSGGGSSYSGLGDNAYGQIVGSDIYNDVFIGRFSASSTAQVTTQVNRVLTYERDLTTSATWCQNGLGISASAGDGGHYDEDDYEHVENLRTDLLNFGYSTVYQDYESVSGYPSSTTTTISNHINSGVGIINYCNHGQETGWQSHYYMNSNVNALTNNNKLPFIFSVACLVGKYDYSSGDCFAETWMHATNSSTPTGAIGGYFSYISQPWIPPMWAQDEFVDILVESYSNNIKHTLGGVGVNSLFAIFDNYSTSESAAVGTYQAWVLYGDPTLMLRTKTPQAMTVTHSGDLPLGTSSYSVNVSNGNGTVATITDANHNILGKATVSNNSATINITGGNLIPNQELTLCVFGYNKVTYLGTITVTGGTQYDITVTQPQHGTISAPTQAYAGTTVTLTATPETGYCLSSWTVKDANNQNITVTNNQFTMPESNVTVTATFVQGLQVTLGPVTNGTISADMAYALQGNTVNLTATPATGYVFDSWVVYKTGDANTTVTVNGNSFTMPNYDVTVVGVFLQLAGGDVTIGSGSSTNSYIPTYSWYNYSLSQQIYTSAEVGEAGSITAVAFKVSNSKSATRSIDLYLSHTNNSSFSGTSAWIAQATSYRVFSGEVTFAASGWTTITLDTPFEYNGTSNLLITVDDNTESYVSGSSNSPVFYTYSTSGSTAIYKYNDYTDYDPASMSTAGTLLQSKNQVMLTKVVPSTEGYLSVTPTSLTGFNTQSGTASASQNVAVIGSNLQSNLTVTAPNGYEVCATQNGTYNSTLTLTPSNGSIRSNVYVRLKATASAATYDDNMTLVSGTTSATVSLSGTVSQGSVTFTITATANPTAGGTVSGAGSYAEGSTATLTATANEGYNFVNWTKNGTQVSTNTTYSFTVTGNAAYVANFTLKSYEVTAMANPAAGGTITGAGSYNHGTTATLTATANAGYTFVNWTKNGSEVSTDATYSFIVTESGSYVAHFTGSIEEQTVVLPIGWSWWSTNVEITLQDLENALSTNGASIVSQNGSVAYLEGLGWDGNITELDLSQMYELNMTGNIELTVSNVLADPADHPITLNSNGYTWIGYPVQQSMNVSDALADLDAEIGDLIKSKSSMAMYMGNDWIGTLNSLEPGHGYMYKSTATTTKTFTYPSNRSGEVKANIIGEGNYWTPEMSRFANNMNMLAVVEFDGAEAMDDNIEVGAFVGDECRGSVRLMRVEETGRYMAFLTIHGETGELVRFRVLNNNGECNVNETIELHINAMVGDLKTPYVLHVGGNSMVLFPNPVAKSEAFRVEMPSNSELNGARVEIFNALGTLVRTETLTGKDVSLVGMTTAGVYTVKVTDRNGNVNFSKLVVE